MQGITRGLPQTTTLAGTDNLAKHLRDAIFRAMARRYTRRVVEGLSDAQLRDSGIDQATVLGNRPTIEVDTRLATYLASLR